MVTIPLIALAAQQAAPNYAQNFFDAYNQGQESRRMQTLADLEQQKFQGEQEAAQKTDTIIQRLQQGDKTALSDLALYAPERANAYAKTKEQAPLQDWQLNILRVGAEKIKPFLNDPEQFQQKLKAIAPSLKSALGNTGLADGIENATPQDVYSVLSLFEAPQEQMTPYQQAQIALQERELGLRGQGLDLDRQKAQAELRGGGFAGQSEFAQIGNILTRGANDEAYRATPEYIYAYSQASQPKMQPITLPDGTTQFSLITPNVPFPPPITGGNIGAGGGMQGGSGASVTPISEPTKIKATVEEKKAASFATRMLSASKILDEVEGELTSATQRGLGATPLIGNFLTGENFKKAEQSRRDFINSQLRKESGAVISKEEFDNAEKQYFPQPGDTPAIIEQKRNARRIAVQSMADEGLNALPRKTQAELQSYLSGGGGVSNLSDDDIKKGLGL